jgi:hypothetical protein
MRQRGGYDTFGCPLEQAPGDADGVDRNANLAAASHSQPDHAKKEAAFCGNSGCVTTRNFLGHAKACRVRICVMTRHGSRQPGDLAGGRILHQASLI